MDLEKKIVAKSLTKQSIENSLKDKAIFVYPQTLATFIATYAKDSYTL